MKTPRSKPGRKVRNREVLAVPHGPSQLSGQVKLPEMRIFDKPRSMFLGGEVHVLLTGK
jgi:hypothetical protein